MEITLQLPACKCCAVFPEFLPSRLTSPGDRWRFFWSQ